MSSYWSQLHVLSALILHPSCATACVSLFAKLSSGCPSIPWGVARRFFEEDLPGDASGVFSTVFASGTDAVSYDLFLIVLASRLDVPRLRGKAALTLSSSWTPDIRIATECGVSVLPFVSRWQPITGFLEANTPSGCSESIQCEEVVAGIEALARELEIPSTANLAASIKRHAVALLNCKNIVETDESDIDPTDAEHSLGLPSGPYRRFAWEKIRRWLAEVSLPSRARTLQVEQQQIYASPALATDVSAPVPRVEINSERTVADVPAPTPRSDVIFTTRRVRKTTVKNAAKAVRPGGVAHIKTSIIPRQPTPTPERVPLADQEDPKPLAPMLRSSTPVRGGWLRSRSKPSPLPRNGRASLPIISSAPITPSAGIDQETWFAARRRAPDALNFLERRLASRRSQM